MAIRAFVAFAAHGSQQDFMQQDNCIVVDADDKVTGSSNKYDSHRFTAEQPHGLLHRAFSVFLFNSEGKLLLQQRAASKITFPGALAGLVYQGRQHKTHQLQAQLIVILAPALYQTHQQLHELCSIQNWTW